MGLLVVGWRFGWLQNDTPEWLWVSAILMVDVAHVYATGFRVYFDRSELRQRPWLYVLAPVLSFLIGLAIYSESPVMFWRCLAYLAVFHFVRQQYGWVALYRARAGASAAIDSWIDTLTIYLATIYPLIYWHAHLPRSFWWFLPGDFVALPELLPQLLAPVYWLVLGIYVGRSIYRYRVLKNGNPGKDIVVGTTVVCWYVGIVAINSDYAFTVTNVIIHGVPYMVLVFWYRWCRGRRPAGRSTYRTLLATRLVAFLGLIWMLAYAEELLWDVGLWHERSWMFGARLIGPEWGGGVWQVALVPLLAVPQLTHYILDGFIWRRRSNREVRSLIEN